MEGGYAAVSAVRPRARPARWSTCWATTRRSSCGARTTHRWATTHPRARSRTLRRRRGARRSSTGRPHTPSPGPTARGPSSAAPARATTRTCGSAGATARSPASRPRCAPCPGSADSSRRSARNRCRPPPNGCTRSAGRSSTGTTSPSTTAWNARAFDAHVPIADTKSFDEWSDATQAYQAALVQLQIEDLRRCKGSPCGGFAVFCLADPSPAVGFGLLDHERVPKRAYGSGARRVPARARRWSIRARARARRERQPRRHRRRRDRRSSVDGRTRDVARRRSTPTPWCSSGRPTSTTPSTSRSCSRTPRSAGSPNRYPLVILEAGRAGPGATHGAHVNPCTIRRRFRAQRRVRFTSSRVRVGDNGDHGNPADQTGESAAGRPGPADSQARSERPADRSLLPSAVGKKWVMAVTGVILMGFIVAHLIGNLKLYLSKEEINLYGEALRDMPGHLLPRTVLLWTSARRPDRRLRAAPPLRVQPHGAQPEGAAAAVPVEARLRRRRLRVAHDALDRHHRAALPRVPPDGSHVGHRELRVRAGRPVQQPRVQPAAAGRRDRVRGREHRARFHLYHGAWSMFQSMGINNPRINKLRRSFAIGFAGLILIGNLSFPILVQAHVMKLEVSAHRSRRPHRARRPDHGPRLARSPQARSKRSGTTTSSTSSSSTPRTSAASTSSSSAPAWRARARPRASPSSATT